MTYTVVSGDTLGTIAAKYLGSSSKYTEIVKANPQITNPNLIKVGQVITIPVPAPVVAAKSPEPSFFSTLFSTPKPVVAPITPSGAHLSTLPAPKPATIATLAPAPQTYLQNKAGYSDQIMDLLQDKKVLMILGAAGILGILLLARKN
jgi:LysM repeat protein